MARRANILEYAILGLLSDSPLHGYELRKRLALVLGPFRPLSFGSLYPGLHRIAARGLITGAEVTAAIDTAAPPLSARRARVVYALTGDGKEAFAAWVNETGPEAWDDEGFATHLAFFSRTEARARVRILHGRRSRLEERVALLRDSMTRSRERVDAYTLQLQKHGLESVEREVRWLSELIEAEESPMNETASLDTQLTKSEPSQNKEIQ
jgi:DNA-binding PadR family transcriptional regulator